MHSSLRELPPTSTLVSRPWLIVHLRDFPFFSCSWFALTLASSNVIHLRYVHLLNGSFVRTVNTTVESRFAWYVSCKQNSKRQQNDEWSNPKKTSLQNHLTSFLLLLLHQNHSWNSKKKRTNKLCTTSRIKGAWVVRRERSSSVTTFTLYSNNIQQKNKQHKST